MRILKITLFTAVLITVVVLFGIGYIWRELAFTKHAIVPVDTVSEIATTTAIEGVASTSVALQAETAKASGTASGTTSTQTHTKAPEPSPIPEPITVTASDLPEAQRAVLETLDMDGASFTITPKMVECAIDALGESRVMEIQKGDAPSLAEGLTLIACMKK